MNEFFTQPAAWIGVVALVLLLTYVPVSVAAARKKRAAKAAFWAQNPNAVRVQVLPSRGNDSKGVYITKINGESPLAYKADDGFYLPVGECALETQNGTKHGANSGNTVQTAVQTAAGKAYTLQLVNGKVEFCEKA